MGKMLAGFVLAFIIAIGGAEARDLPMLEKARASVVSVLPQWPGSPPNAERPEGSGVVLTDGRLVVTAAHVIGSGQQVASNILVRDEDGNVQRASVVRYDQLIDLALLKLETPLTPAVWMQQQPRIGEEVCAIGNAFGLGLSVTCGHISAVHKAGVGFNPIEDFIQTDASVNPGMSGGALINSRGELAGIVSAIFTKQADASIGVNFAVDARLVQQFIAVGKFGDKFVPYNPGAGIRNYPPTPQPGREGVEVIKVLPGFPAAKAGLKEGDIIYIAAGRRVRKRADWLSVMAGAASAATVELSGMRGDVMMTWRLAR